jgi:tRNA G10  N-methylase Trm11
MMWFDKSHKNTIYGDRRRERYEKYGRTWEITPDVMYDFCALPFADNLFDLVVFDPPHLKRCGTQSWLALKYGKLFAGWEDELREGFLECKRVLKPQGTLIFKWSDADIKHSKIFEIIGEKPMFGHTTTKNMMTHWFVFQK